MKKIYSLILFICLMLPPTVFSADWYVRPSGGNYGNEDGTSYDNAWDGFSNIDQGQMQAGDILWLDGNATYSSEPTIFITVAITIDGSYGGGKAVIDAQNIRSNAIIINVNSPPTIKNIIIKNTTNNSVGYNVVGYAFKMFNCEIVSSGNNGIAITGDGGILQNIVITDSVNSGIYGNNVSNWSIKDIVITGSGSNDGITLHDGSGTNNTISHCIIEGFSENSIDIQVSYSATVIENVSSRSSGMPAFYLKGSGTARYCTVYNSSSAPFYVLGDWNCYYNLIYNSGTSSNSCGFYITSSSADCIIANNTIVASSASVRHPIVCEAGIGSIKIINNVIDVSKASARRCIYFYDGDDLDDAEIDHNCYYIGAGNYCAQIESNAYTTLTDWQNDTIWNNCRFDQKSLEQDPLLDSNYRLQLNSPCIDAGTKLSIHDSDWQDLDGNTTRYGMAPDIGCYEYHTWPLGAWGQLPWTGNKYKLEWTAY